MSISEYVRRVQRTVVVAGIVNVLAAALSVFLFMVGVAAFFNADSAALVSLATAAAAVVVIYFTLRLRTVRSPGHIALWIEEIVPDLNYAVVTSVENGSTSPDIDRLVRLETVHPAVRARLTRFSTRSFVLLAVSAVVFVASPATSFGRGRVQSALSSALPGIVPPVDKLARLRIRVVPPAYLHSDPTERVNAASITVLSGSRIELSGNGSPQGISASVNGEPVVASGNGTSWTVNFVAVKPVSVMRVTFQSASRLVVVEATPDNAPRVTLTAPLRDSALRTPRFTVNLRATTTDDIGLADGYFEYLIVSGSGEAFSGRTVTSSPFRFDSKTGSMQARLDFGSQKIGAGDLVSIRAVVRDNNTLTGPTVGTSDTRTFRVARADEYDSVSIEAAAPPPVDSSAMSQRMLILMTEALVKKQKTLTRQQLVKQSDDIGFLEDRIRKRVYDILYQTDSPEGVGDTEEVESEIQAINNPDLKQAYDALWDAVRSLRIAEPAVALPPMRVALKALDRARLAKRLYLRGAAPKIVVDVAHVRLTGKDKGVSSVRTPQFAADSLRRFFITGLQEALEKRRSDSRQAIEDLSLLRARALPVSHEFAAALKELIDALQQNRAPDAALVRARKALGPSLTRSAVTDWGGG